MTLRNYLYNVLEAKETPDGVTYSISLNRESPIYQAHFPGMPVTPGVCIIQMVEEMLADYTGKVLQIATVKNAKFLTMLEPGEEIVKVHLSNIRIEGESIKAHSTITDCSSTIIYAKISVVCNEQ